MNTQVLNNATSSHSWFHALTQSHDLPVAKITWSVLPTAVVVKVINQDTRGVRCILTIFFLECIYSISPPYCSRLFHSFLFFFCRRALMWSSLRLFNLLDWHVVWYICLICLLKSLRVPSEPGEKARPQYLNSQRPWKDLPAMMGGRGAITTCGHYGTTVRVLFDVWVYTEASRGGVWLWSVRSWLWNCC